MIDDAVDAALHDMDIIANEILTGWDKDSWAVMQAGATVHAMLRRCARDHKRLLDSDPILKKQWDSLAYWALTDLFDMTFAAEEPT